MSTLPEFLELAYLYSAGIGSVTADPAPDCAAAGFDRADLQSRVDDLGAVEDRCIVSKVQRNFLQRVLAAMP